jgi:hypothetical protein
VLADVLDRDGRQSSASQTRQQARANADHLAILHAIWTAETTPAREQHYRDLLMTSLQPEYRREPGHQARWLWRTMRAAELAGLDTAQVLAAAIGERDLAGFRDLAAVIDGRLRSRIGTAVPVPASPWSAQVPAIADPERRAFAAQIAAMMDARKERIGEHAAQNALPWAVNALGPAPEDPLGRLDWQRRASSIGAYRELSSHCDPADPIGPEPAAAAPDLRAAWHEALAALGPADGPDVRGMPDGRLLHLRDTYPIETAWAPQWVGDEPATDSQRAELNSTAGQPPRETGQWINDLAAAHRTFAGRLADRQNLTIPAEDPRYGDLGQAFPPWPGRGKDAILQPPKPEIRPSPQVLERAADRDADWEAAD